jgi:hypothetical protein
MKNGLLYQTVVAGSEVNGSDFCRNVVIYVAILACIAAVQIVAARVGSEVTQSNASTVPSKESDFAKRTVAVPISEVRPKYASVAEKENTKVESFGSVKAPARLKLGSPYAVIKA